ncbi:DUF1328 domain-containing protein [Dyella choica]
MALDKSFICVDLPDAGSPTAPLQTTRTIFTNLYRLDSEYVTARLVHGCTGRIDNAERATAAAISSICTEIAMLYWAAVIFIIAICIAVFGFVGIAAGAASIAKILVILFVILFVLSLIVSGIRRRPRS